MDIKNTVAPTRLSLIIGDSQCCSESQTTASVSHSDLCSQLLKNPTLRGWERLFVKTLAKTRNPGKKQREKLEAIASRLNGNGGEG